MSDFDFELENMKRYLEEARRIERIRSAGPELLVALEGLRALIIGEHGVSAYENIDGERADAAIAKAKGDK